MTNKEKKELQVTEKKTIEKVAGEPTRDNVTFVPEVDISETEDAILLIADLPGVTRDNLTIDVCDGVLTLTATVPSKPDNHRLLYREYDIGGYTRRFTLGERIDQESIQANLQNGVLKLTLPKAEETKPRKIQIS